MPIIDPKAMLELLGDQDFCVSVMNIFLETATENRQQINDLGKAKDMEVCEGLHALKGNLSYLCAGSAVDLVERMSTEAESGQWPKFEASLEEFDTTITTLETEIHQLIEQWS